MLNSRWAQGVGAFVVTLSLAMGIMVVLGQVTKAEVASPSPTATPTPRALAAAVTPSPKPTKAPKDKPGRHTVQPGETLFSIALDLGVSEEQLRYWNYKKHLSLRSFPREIKLGWVLITKGSLLPTSTPGPNPSTPEFVPTYAPLIDSNGSPTLVALPRIAVDVWNAAEDYHDISGRNPNELLQSANANPDCDGHPACAGP